MPTRSLLSCDFDASLFLARTAEDGRTRFCFLDELPAWAGVPVEVINLITEISSMLDEIAPLEEEMRSSGMLGHGSEISAQMDKLRKDRAQCLAAFCLPSTIAANLATRSSLASSSWSAPSVAAALHAEHMCVIDGFVASPAALRARLTAMRAAGELKPGEVSGGLRTSTRGDLMKWVSTEAGKQPSELHELLASIDALVSAISREPLLQDDLGGGKLLVRHEMQCTCYPGNGARYVKHVDDALAHRGRRLTVIAYCNPGWERAHGGSLRLHVKRGPRDVDPLDGRLVLFWSDARCPHEVLPAYRERYAVSVWFSDAEALRAAALAEQRAGAARAAA